MYTVGYLKTLHAEDDFVDAIQELIQGFLATGTVKSFQVKAKHSLYWNNYKCKDVLSGYMYGNPLFNQQAEINLF